MTRSTPDPSATPATVTWLALVIVAAGAPHLSRFPFFISLYCLLLGSWRIHTAWRGLNPFPRRSMQRSAVLLGMGMILVGYHTLFRREAGVALLFVMLFMKLFELKSARDVLLTSFLSYFLVFTNFLYAQTIPMGLYMLVVTLLITTQLITFHRQGVFSRDNLKLAARLLWQAAPLALVLFLLFPRIPGPLWGLPKEPFAARSGLSDSMSPGSIGNLISSGEVAFRVRFEDQPPPPALLYWRGPVFEFFMAGTWSPSTIKSKHTPALIPLGGKTLHEVTLEPHNRHWLFVLDLPSRHPSLGHLQGDFQVHAPRDIRQLTRYSALSYTRYRADPYLGTAEQRRNRLLPGSNNPRARALAASWRMSGLSDKGLVEEALSYFLRGAFSYTLTPGAGGLLDSVDRFLFEEKQGFCEHYASAFTFLMRAAGVPARVVTGYQGGEINSSGGHPYLIVRQSDAHAWSEVWLNGTGWVRVDPTATVAPERISRGLAAAMPDLDQLPLLERPNMDFLRPLRLAWDAANHQWNNWVLGYDNRRQRHFLEQLGLEVSFTRMALWLTALVGVLLLALLLHMTWQKPAIDPACRHFRRFQRKMSRLGVSSLPHEGPMDYASRAQESLADPSHREALARICHLYADLRYGPPGTMPGKDYEIKLQNLKKWVAQFPEITVE